nr:hypothetical protein [Tanacetum cinerariifolium]
MEETHHCWRFQTFTLSLRTTEYRDRVEPTTRIIPQRLKHSCVGYLSWFPRPSKYKTARELWAAILKTFGGNEATKKRKKNLLMQQYGNFKAEGSESLEQTFNRLQVIVGKLQFMDVEVEQDDLNQKFFTTLAPEWLLHTIVWRNRSDLDTMSLDDMYNNLKVYESEVQKKSDLNSQNMAFISSAKYNSRNEDRNTACVSTASTIFPTASASVASISQDTVCAYIASQSSGSQIKFEDINQIDEDDMERMDIKWSMALLSMRADKSPTNANIANNQRGNRAGQKVACYECGAQGHFKRYCPKLKNNNNNHGNQVGTGNAQARVYAVGNAGTNPDANTVTDHDYAVELADGRIVGVNTIIRSCTLNFLNHPFNIDLMPVEMGSFDVIIGMDWLSRYQAVIVCEDKIVRIS